MALPATVTLTLLRGKVTARDGKSPRPPLRRSGVAEHWLIASLIMAARAGCVLIAFVASSR